MTEMNKKDHKTNQLNVLHIFSGDLWAGAEVMIFNLLKQLKNDPKLNIIGMCLNDGILKTKLQEAGIKTLVIPESTYLFPRIFLKAINLLKWRKIDIIHSHRYKESLLALLLAKTFGVKRLVATLHGLSEPPLYKQNGIGQFYLRTKLEYYFLRRYFSRVVVVSQDMRKVLTQRYPFSKEKVCVVYNGIECPQSFNVTSSKSPNRCFQIGTAGRMVPVKDFELFLQVASEIRSRLKDVRFSILGDGPLKGRLMQKANDLGVVEDVEFLPPKTDPFPYYQSLDLYLNTSLHEGMPMSILEAMACGKPVVAPRAGGIPEIILHGENGFLVDDREVKGYVDLCLKLIEDENLRTKIGEKASKWIASGFSSLQMASGYSKLYREICPSNVCSEDNGQPI